VPSSTCPPPTFRRTSAGTGLSGVDGVIAYQLEHGWLMWVPPDPDERAGDHTDLPDEVLAVQRYARHLGCDYVLFDVDADQVGAAAHLALVTTRTQPTNPA